MAQVVEASLDASSLRSDIARRMFEAWRRLGDDGVGITRPAFTETEDAAMDAAAALAREYGLVVGWDPAGNLTVDLPGTEPEAPLVMIGSHLDSVPQGGNYDGAAGVLAGLLCQIRFIQTDTVVRRTVRTTILRGEESPWFGQCYLGSLALLGGLSETDLALTHARTGRTLREHLSDKSAAIDMISAGKALIDPASIAAFFELHIEQGPVLVARDLPVGVVTGIRGNVRHRRIVCRGEAGHSGAVPRWLRKDAVFATVEFLSHIDEHWAALMERGLDLVVTSGIVYTNADEHAMSRIPGECTFSLEVRSQSQETLQAFHHLVATEARQIGTQRRVEFTFDNAVFSTPATLDRGLVDRLLASAEALGVPAEAMPSGAGHDAAVFANAGIPTAMLFVRNRNGSHNPHEEMDLEDFIQATDVLYNAVADAAR